MPGLLATHRIRRAHTRMLHADCGRHAPRHARASEEHDARSARQRSAPQKRCKGWRTMTDAPRIVIVGAGPAGVRAAETLVAAGLRPLVLDDQARCGGQIYRQPGAGFERAKRSLYGFEATKAHALHTTMDALLAHIDYQSDTLVWDCEARHGQGGRLVALRNSREQNVPFSHLILATGATDRVLPIPGWTL